MPTFLILLIVIGLVVVWLIAIYNGFVKSRMHTKEAWSQIDVQLKRRNDLIPNLIETVKGYASYEEKTFEKIAELRSQVARATTPAATMEASNELSKQVASIIAVAENYPELKANQNFLKLQDELTNTENKISYSRQLFNTTTANYNAKLEMFPGNIVGKLFGFKASEFLQTPEEEKAVPKVEFNF
ncbi:LemA family protein [Streptococcus iniae]|uniref:LemA family protein n=1 Tax=Streptococcus iniae TaxID=1346 RepID=UPI000EF83507|nr:LemA family protein [Streptococcus iniae]RLV11399.1 LemA family protein [Streptococcus iniae]